MTAAPFSPEFRRHLLGISAVVLLATGIYFWVYPPASAQWDFLHGSCVKSGIVLFAAWLAFPQVHRLPVWVFVTVVSLLLLVAIRPRIMLALARYVVVFLPLLIAIWFLRPKRFRHR